MGRKIFISYKYADTNVRQNPNIWWRSTRVRDYVDKLQELIGEENINKGEQDGEDLSVLEDTTIQSILGDKIYDSSITLVLISPNMKEQYKSELDQWIPWEISYSLREQTRNGRQSKTNAVMAIVLPDTNNSYEYFLQEHSCPYCNTITYMTNRLFKILSANMFNRYRPTYSTCTHHITPPEIGEFSYIPCVKWDDFIENIENNLQRVESIKNNIDLYNIKKNIRPLLET